MHDHDLLLANHLLSEMAAATLSAPRVASDVRAGGRAAVPALEEIEMARIRRVLDICQGSHTLAGHQLGIVRQTVAKKLGPAEEA